MGAIEDCKLVKPKGASWDAPERVARKVVLGAHRRGGQIFSYSTSPKTTQCQQGSIISSNRHSEYRNT